MKRYSKEFREEALKLSDDIGVKKASEQLNVVYGTLTDWRKKRAKKAADPKVEMTEEEYRKENERLRKEIAEINRANDILKDALGFFAKDRKK
jgi:transposase